MGFYLCICQKEEFFDRIINILIGYILFIFEFFLREVILEDNLNLDLI